jgi:hypothetical protein
MNLPISIIRTYVRIIYSRASRRLHRTEGIYKYVMEKCFYSGIEDLLAGIVIVNWKGIQNGNISVIKQNYRKIVKAQGSQRSSRSWRPKSRGELHGLLRSM